MEFKKGGGILIIILFISSLIFTTLQSFAPTKTIEIPKQNIVEKLNTEQENYLIEKGYTILKIQYNVNCEKCLAQKIFLEQIASSPQFKNQVFLEEILTDTKTPKIEMISMYGRKILENESEEKIIDALCEIIINPPVQCAFRGLT